VTFSVRSAKGSWFAGTPAYMAPELFSAQAADARSDQFAFCVALYEALLGERPFRGTTLAELREAIVRGELHLPSKATSLPKRMVDLLLRGLSPDRGERFTSMNELLAALAASARRRPRMAWPLGAVLGLGVILGVAGLASTRARGRVDGSPAPPEPATAMSVVMASDPTASPALPEVSSALSAQTETPSRPSATERKHSRPRLAKPQPSPQPTAATMDDLRPPAFAQKGSR
jgi:serine/threonine protein kinase